MSSSATTSSQAPPAGQYAVDGSSSTVTFITKHMFGLGKVRGRLAVAHGSVLVADQIEDSTVDVEIPAASFSTRNPLRDSQVRSPLFLNARRHQAITFRATSIRRQADGWTVSGTLTVKGRSGPVDLTVTDIDVRGATVIYTAEGTVDRYALGVSAMRGMAARHLSVTVTAHTHRI
jgi:polyisoprenoid-binding protein YceI